jgi:predicted kinase
MPHIGAFKVINSDVQLRRFQYERAVSDFETLRQVADEKSWAKKTAEMSYQSNDGAMVDFKLDYDRFQQFANVDDFWRTLYKPYYATYFGERSKAKKSTDELADKKIGKGDVVILDSTGVNTSKMLNYFKQGHAKGYTTSIVWLEIDPDYSIARDAYRGETEGRSVGKEVILSYVPKIATAWKSYLAEHELVDRLLHFRWDGGVVKGQYNLVRDLKRYPRKEKVEKLAANTLKRDVIATLLRADRRDLATAVARDSALFRRG